jgi:hypothetical protein
LWRLKELATRPSTNNIEHLVFIIANHFEPGVGREGLSLLDSWVRLARATGMAVHDHDGTFFRHTNFVPAEQYDRDVIDILAGLQSEGLGEVEIHFHHGVDQPDTAENTRRVLTEFRDRLAEQHRCLSRERAGALPRYAFVHGNWALANSAGGRYCGVDSEMQILADTGCYADFTLPSAPDQSQVPKINAVYECGNPLSEAKPHRSGQDLIVNDDPKVPIIFTGPLVLDWTRRLYGLPIPRIDDGALAQNYPLTLDRLHRWRSARIGVKGRPDWIFIKLYSHGFFEWDQDAMIGEQMKRFVNEVLEHAEKTGKCRIHFACAREAYNMVIAAVDGHAGDPHEYRDYRLRPIMKESSSPASVDESQSSMVLG